MEREPKRRPILRRLVKILLAAAMLGAVVAAFCGVRACALAAKIQFLPALVAMDVAMIAAFLVLAVVFGRLYCDVVCPLGIVQEFLRWCASKKVRRVCTRLPETSRQLVVKWTVLALFVVAGMAGLSFVWLDPYAIFGRGITLSGVIFFMVLALAAAGKGRFWCNWICPVGTVLQALSRIAVFKDRVAKCDHCEECRKCFEK